MLCLVQHVQLRCVCVPVVLHSRRDLLTNSMRQVMSAAAFAGNKVCACLKSPLMSSRVQQHHCNSTWPGWSAVDSMSAL